MEIDRARMNAGGARDAESAGQKRRSHAKRIEQVRQAVVSVCSNCAQVHLTPTHSGLLQPKFAFRLTLG